jgi:hypothetical protein
MPCNRIHNHILLSLHYFSRGAQSRSSSSSGGVCRYIRVGGPFQLLLHACCS